MDPAQFDDLTGVECFVNHLHFQSLARALTTAEKIRRTLEESFSGAFQIIVAGRSGDFTVRFHKKRAGESWLSEDLEGYEEEAVLLLGSDDRKFEHLMPQLAGTASRRTSHSIRR